MRNPTPPGLAFVTGASSGIGAAIAQRLARRGFTTVLMARRSDRLQAVAGQCDAYAPSFAEPIDLTRIDQLRPRVEELVARHGHPRVLVNTAGGGMYARFLDQDTDTEDRLLRLNYLAASRLIRAVLPMMLQRRGGHVINIASISAKMSPWGHASYTPTKAALVALTQALAADYAGTGVRFSYVLPGIVDTEYFRDSPTLRLLWPSVARHAIPPDRVARRTVKLLDRPRLELCVPASYRVLDLLCCLSPALAHRLVYRNSRPASPPAPHAPAETPQAPEAPQAPETIELHRPAPNRR